MCKNKIRFLTVVAAFLATIIVIMSLPGAVFSNGPPSSDTKHLSVDLTVAGSGNSTEVPDSLSFNSVTLNGSVQEITNAAGSFPIDVTDASGLAGGWNVTLAATTFTGTHSTSNVLPDNVLTVCGLLASKIDSTSTMPSSNIDPSTSPVMITTAPSNPTASLIYDAVAGSGMGSFELNTQLKLYLPADLNADRYTSTMTVVVASRLS